MYFNEILPWGIVNVQSLQAHILYKKNYFLFSIKIFKKKIKLLQFNFIFMHRYFAVGLQKLRKKKKVVLIRIATVYQQ